MEQLAFDIGGTSAFDAPISEGQLGAVVGNGLSVVLVVSGILFVFIFIFAGIGLIRGAGNSNPEDAAKARKAVTYAVIGFLVVFTAFWIIRIIEIVTGVDFLTGADAV